MGSGVRAAVGVGLSFLALFAVSACGGADSGDSSPSDVPEAITQPSAAVLVDVRTPEEFAAGHLEGAVNIPLGSPGFTSAVKAAVGGSTVEVYCRSGNRSQEAVAQLAGSGLVVIDLGGYESAASATGKRTV